MKKKKKLSQPLRVDFEEDVASFVTRRVRNSQLVFANNKGLEERILGSLGKYQDRGDVTIYAYTIFGSHDHNLMRFKDGTKSDFFRDFGARTAEAIKKYTNFGEGSVFARRTSEQAVPPDENGYLESVMYCVLQPIAAGLCKNLSDYPGFNCFHYLLTGKPVKVRFFKAYEYNRAKRSKKFVDPEDFYEYFEIKFARIPGYEHMSQEEYAAFLMEEYEKRREKIISAFEEQGHVWMGAERLRRVRTTECAKGPKKCERIPLIICKSAERTAKFFEWYYAIVAAYKEASSRYLRGETDIVFPRGTHKPPGPYVN